MKHLLLFILIAGVCTSFKPRGSGTAYLNCKSESGRTLFTAEIQDIAGLLEKAELIVDGRKLAFTEDDEAFTIFDPQTNVFTMYISGKRNNEFPNGRFIQFYAIPKSFRIICLDDNVQKYEFKANIEATEPRSGKDLRLPKVKLNCTLEYKI